MMIYQQIADYCNERKAEFDEISTDRKTLLQQLASEIRHDLKETGKTDLVYICTHNSRRSHFSQVWAHLAAVFYNLNGIHSYSGGTETTALHSNAIEALRKVGFVIETTQGTPNPKYDIRFDNEQDPVVCFSKRYDDASNPSHGFIAIMTCSDAEENCPWIPGARVRLATTYSDPKAGDHGPEPWRLYDERCAQIARETLYMFSLVV